MKKWFTLIAGLLACTSIVQAQQPAPAVSAPEVYIISPLDGAKVSSPVTVQFGLKGMGIAPAGIQMDNTGHHHLFIDTPLPTDLTKPIGMEPNKIVHFGKGQTETTLTLPPGKHTLQLLLGDYLHVPQAQPLASKQITIIVK